jgi:hypothetical protein
MVVQSEYPYDCVVAVLPQVSKPFTTRRLAPHIQIVERVIEWKSLLLETADGLRTLCVRHIVPQMILPVEREDTSMGASFLLPRLVQPKEIADIGRDHRTLLDRGIAEMSSTPRMDTARGDITTCPSCCRQLISTFASRSSSR